MLDGEYIFYGDESGDHSLVNVDSDFPVFVLSVCGFKINDYCKRIVPKFQSLKFRYFGHDMIILHEREIRKQEGSFSKLTDMIFREKFLLDLTDVIKTSKFKIFSVVIDKHKLKYDLFPDNPYAIALKHSLEEIYKFLKIRKIHDRRYYFVFEKRGSKEDKDLELEFRRITSGENIYRELFSGFNIVFADKKSNSTGMQISDLTARPIGLRYFRSSQSNRSYDVIDEKIYRCKNTRRFHRGVFPGGSTS